MDIETLLSEVVHPVDKTRKDQRGIGNEFLEHEPLIYVIELFAEPRHVADVLRAILDLRDRARDCISKLPVRRQISFLEISLEELLSPDLLFNGAESANSCIGIAVAHRRQ